MKPPAWTPPEGTSGVDDYILPILLAHAALFALHGVLYSSRDMKIGISVKQMVALLPLIMALVGVDPRGAYFRQEMMEQAVQQVLHGEEYKAAALANATAAKPQLSLSEFVADQAYAIRVVLSHYRDKFYSWTETKAKTASKSTPVELINSFSCMSESLGNPESAAKKKKKRKCVFLAYQSSSSPSDEETEEEDVRVVLEYFDWGARKAYRRYNDNKQKNKQTES